MERRGPTTCQYRSWQTATGPSPGQSSGVHRKTTTVVESPPPQRETSLSLVTPKATLPPPSKAPGTPTSSTETSKSRSEWSRWPNYPLPQGECLRSRSFACFPPTRKIHGGEHFLYQFEEKKCNMPCILFSLRVGERVICLSARCGGCASDCAYDDADGFS